MEKLEVAELLEHLVEQEVRAGGLAAMQHGGRGD